MSRVFLNTGTVVINGANTGDAIGSLSADGKTVSEFYYNASGKMSYINQYKPTSAVPMWTVWGTILAAALSGEMSRVFLNSGAVVINGAYTGDAIGSLSADGKTVSEFYYNASGKMSYINQYKPTGIVPMGTVW